AVRTRRSSSTSRPSTPKAGSCAPDQASHIPNKKAGTVRTVPAFFVVHRAGGACLHVRWPCWPQQDSARRKCGSRRKEQPAPLVASAGFFIADQSGSQEPATSGSEA